MRSARSRVLGLLLVSGLALPACSGPARPDPAPPSATAPSEAATGAQARQAAQRVCADFAVAALSVDGVIDRGPADARQRAAAEFGTPALVERLGGEGRDHEWTSIVRRHARVQVDTTPIADDPHAPAEGRAGAGVLARRVAVGKDGRRQELAATATYCSLVATAQGWKVADVAFSDASTSGTPR